MGNEGAIHVLSLVSEFTAREGISLTATGYESLYCAQPTRVAYTEKEQSSLPTLCFTPPDIHCFSGIREDCRETGHSIFFGHSVLGLTAETANKRPRLAQ